MRFIYIFLFFLSSTAFSQTFTFPEQHHWGTTGDDSFFKILKTSDGGYLVVGSTENSNNSHVGPIYGLSDYWVIKLNLDYMIVWEKVFGGTDNDNAYDIIEYSDNKFLIIGTSFSPLSGNKTVNNYGSSDVWVVAIDLNGNQLWQNIYGSVDGSENTYFNCGVKKADNELLIVCSSNGSVTGSKTTTSFGGPDYYLISIDTNGNQLGDYSYGGSSNEIQCSIRKENEEIFIFGNSLSGVSGNKTTPNYGAFDAWLIKVEENMLIADEFNFGGSGWDFIQNIIAMNDKYIISGSSDSPISGNKTSDLTGLSDGIIIETDTSFNLLSEQSIGFSSAYSSLNDIYLQENTLYFVGNAGGGTSLYKDEPSLGSSDFWTVAFDTALNYKWNFSLGGNAFEGTIIGGLFLNTDFTFDLFFNSSSAGFTGDLTVGNFGSQDLVHVKVESDLSIRGEEKIVDVFPNPFTSELTVLGDFSELEIVNNLGQIVYKSIAENKISLAFLPSGTYLLRLTDNAGNVGVNNLIKY